MPTQFLNSQVKDLVNKDLLKSYSIEAISETWCARQNAEITP